MLGGATVASYGHTRSARAEEALRAEGVTLRGAIEDISISVRRGEIVGLAGLVGAGRTSVLRCLAGVEPQSTGRLWIDGSEVRWPRKPRDALRYGIALLPEERKTDGLVLGMSVADNLTLPNLRRASRFGLVSQRRQRALASELLERFNLSSRRVATAARNLSGGNQQKVVLGKWMYARPNVLLCDEPTRGIDVGAKAEVLASIEEAAESGLAVIMTSSELEEVLAVSDRVTVLAAGRLVTEYNARARELSVSEVLHAAFGLHDGDETGNKAH
jgi:ABC-type sugar transport system ATPase subunit